MIVVGIEYEISVQDVMIENYQDALASGEFSGSSKVSCYIAFGSVI